MKTSVIDQILLNCISIAEKRVEIVERRIYLKSQCSNAYNNESFNNDHDILKKRNEIRQIRIFTKELLSDTINNPDVVNEIEGGLNNYIANRSVFICEIGNVFMKIHSYCENTLNEKYA